MGNPKIVRSYVCGSWHEATDGFRVVVNPSTEEVVAEVSSQGVDFGAVVSYAQEEGYGGLQALNFAERGGLLKSISKVLREHRDELLDLSRQVNGTTTRDGAFDIDGATGTLAYYASVGKGIGARRTLLEGERAQLSREGTFMGRHLLVPRRGVAVHINAFNFPAWGFAEKAACALLAGMPVITKPATATALVTERCIELLVEAEVLPAGSLQLVCGSLGNLIDLLGPQDVVAFTGSADTASTLRQQLGDQGVNARFNVEADSLNAAVLAPDVRNDSATRKLFLREVVREMTQKTGQKCTAVRRILVPETDIDGVELDLAEKLSKTVVGDPKDESVTMGPLATQSQLQSVIEGVQTLSTEAQITAGTGGRVEGVGGVEGKGYFVGPTLLRVAESPGSGAVHDLEVFGPVATLIPYDGSATRAAEIVGLAGGTLVTSLYSDDTNWVEEYVLSGGSSGRIFVGSEDSAAESPGSGVAMPQSMHGGPGRAGGGEELGGLIGVNLYLQRVAVQGAPSVLEAVEGVSTAEDTD